MVGTATPRRRRLQHIGWTVFETCFLELLGSNNTGAMAESREYDPTVYTRSAHVYDVMNAARGKSYSNEATKVLQLVRERVADAETLLDVACGTGLHLSSFRNDLRVVGVEPHPLLRAIARDRLVDVPVHDGDMRTLNLGHRFDVVTCLFSAIGYMLTTDDLHAAIRRMAAHLNPGGVLVVEPWFHPEAWIDGLVIAESTTVDGLAITRLSHSIRYGHISRFEFYWSVGRGPTLNSEGPGSGIDDELPVEQWTEPHRLALWTDSEYREAFSRSGLEVEHDSEGLIGRGLYLGRKSLD